MRNGKWEEVQYLMIGILVALAGVTSHARASEANGQVLSVHDLQRVASQVRHFRPKDQFETAPHVSDLTGQHFSVIIRPRERGPANAICKGFPSWGYYAQKQNFEVSFDDGSMLVDRLMNVPFAAAFPSDNVISSSFLRFTSFTCKHMKEGSYRANNAFGATISVTKEKDVVLAVSTQGQPSRVPTTTSNYWSQTTSGDAARKLSQDVAIRVTGVIGVWPNGQNVICGVKHNQPSLDLPYDETLDACIFKAKSLTFEVINKRTGAVLYNISNQPDHPGA